MSKHKFSNILLTGAAGALGEQLRKTLSQNCNLLRISDKEKLVKKFKNEIETLESIKKIDVNFI